ncbi:MAG: two-component regulator propeller domain-containing protein [Chitinophagaceae bacterium]
MTALRSLFFLSIIALFPVLNVAAQQTPIGYWRAMLPYNRVLGIATDGHLIYAISEKGFFSLDPSSGSFETYSKVEGMHETNTAALAYDKTTGTCVIGYQNSNIDLFKDNSFYVIPDLKNKSFSGNKAINDIYAANGIAYVSTGLGIVAIDLKKQEVKETYVFSKNGQTISINSFMSDATNFYAATASGLYKTSQNNPNIQAFATWQSIDTNRNFTKLALVGGNTLYTTSADTIFQITPSGLSVATVCLGATITDLSGGDTTLYIGEFFPATGAGKMIHLSTSDTRIDSTQVAYTSGAIETQGGQVYVADAYQGLGKRNSNTSISLLNPAGPNSPGCAGLWANNGELWIAHGGIRENFTQLKSADGISNFKDGKWTTYQPYNYPLFQDSVVDFLSVIKDPRDGTLYAGTYNSGIFELKENGDAKMIKQGALEFSGGDVNGYPATSLAIDNDGNLYATQIQIPDELAVRNSTGDWYHYPISLYGRIFRQGLGLLIDDYNQKWYYSAQGDGVIVYDDGGTPSNPNDDRQTQLNTSVGQGNLPNMRVRCLAKDRDGAIWIGTDAGIGIVNCPALVIDQKCDAEQRVVQYDNFAGLLFSTESVRAIAVDGANRKWVGTLNGVWLLSPDALTILNRFTVDNSPLPSNVINSITVDGVTGDVYIGTQDGIVSYRAAATVGSDKGSNVQVFPNPVPTGYSGQIAIRGLTTDADVRITDITGKLVYRAKATGGQAAWNGLDYTGTRPSSGVYLIFVSDKMGTQTAVGKLLFKH